MSGCNIKYGNEGKLKSVLSLLETPHKLPSGIKRNLLNLVCKPWKWSDPTHLPSFSCFSFPNILCIPVPLAFQSSILSPLLGPPICFCLCPGTLPLPLFNQLSSSHAADLTDVTSLSWVVGSEDNSSVSEPQLYHLLSV